MSLSHRSIRALVRLDLYVCNILVQASAGDVIRRCLKDKKLRPVYCAMTPVPVMYMDSANYHYFPSHLQTLPTDMQDDCPKAKFM